MMRDAKLWTWHVLAGVVIFVFLGLHMLIMHLDDVVKIASLNPAGGHPIDWANVVARGKMIFFPVTYTVLLGAALFHGLYGLKNILFELNLGQAFRRVITVALLLLGVGLFVYGTWAAFASLTLARSL